MVTSATKAKKVGKVREKRARDQCLLLPDQRSPQSPKQPLALLVLDPDSDS